MADDYIITITYSLDTGNVEGEASAAGKKAGDAFGKNFKPQLDWVNKVSEALNPDEVGKKAVSGISNAFKNLNLSMEIEKSLSGVDFAKTNFGRGLQKTITQAAASASAAPEIIPPKPSQGVTGEGANLTARIQPFLSGLEAFSMMMRGAPFLSVAQMAGQAITGFQSLRAGAAIEPGRTYFPGGRPGETENLAITRRLGTAAAAGGAAAAEAGGVGAVEAGALGLGAGAAMGLLKAGGAVGTAIGVGVAVQNLRDKIADLGKEEAKVVVSQKLLGDVMGLSQEQLLRLGTQFAKSGVPLGELDYAFFRLAATAKRQMPAIEREVEDSGNKQEETHIKVRDSLRALDKAHDEHQAAVERVSHAEGELRKVQETGADVRQQERRAAELGVTGALIGQRGAEMRQAQAAIGLQFAPQEAQFADIRGAQTVEGARLGRQGAGIQYEEALAKFRAQRYGEEEDPQVVELRQRRKEELALASARHNRDQADLQEREAQSAEQKRQAQVAAGVGPEAQAQQQALEAAQAKEMADLHVQRAVTFKEQLRITQESNTQQMEENARKRDLADSVRNVGAASDQEAKTTIELDRAKKEEERFRYKNIPDIQKAIRGEVGAEFDVRQVEPEKLREALLRQGGYQVPGILEAIRSYGQSRAMQALPEDEQTSQLLEAIQVTVGGRGLAGIQPKLLAALRKPAAELTEEDERVVKEFGALRDRALKQGERIEETEGAATVRQQLAREKAAEPAMAPTPDIIARQTEGVEQTQAIIRTGLETLNTAGKVLDNIGSGVKAGLDSVVEATGEVAGALRAKAQEIQSIEFPSPTKTTGVGEVQAVEAGSGGEGNLPTNQQHGGLLHGSGTGTSDDIPINASAGEYVVRASEVRKPGILAHLESINQGHGFQAGGLVSGATATPPATLDDYERWVYLHGVVPSRQDWNDAKAAGLDPAASFDKDGNLIASAAALIKAKKGSAKGPSAAAPTPQLGQPIVAGPGVGISQGTRFAPGQQPQGQLSNQDFQQALKDRGYTIPPGSVVIRNPFFPDQSAQIRLPNRGPMILVPPPSPPTTGAPSPAAPPGIQPVPGTRFQYPRGGPMVLYPPSVIGPKPPPGAVFPGQFPGDPALPKTLSPQESEELKKRRDEAVAQAQKQFDEEKRSKERIATDQKAIAEAQDPNSPSYLEKLNKLGDAFGQAGDIIERSHELTPYEEIPIPRPRMRPDDLLDAIKKLIPDELLEKPAKPSMDELRKRLIEPGNPVVDPQFRGDVGDVGRQFAAIKPADLLDTVPETGPGSLPTEPPRYIPTEPMGGPEEIPTRRWDWNFDRPSDEIIDLAKGGLVRRYFQSGGLIGGGEVDPATFAELSLPRITPFEEIAVRGLAQRFSQPGALRSMEMLGSALSSLSPVGINFNPYTGGGMASNALGYYQLNLMTSAGNFPAAIGTVTMEGILSSALAGKLTQTGAKPSWFS